MLTKIVDGKSVEMAADEEAATLAEWEANDPAKQSPAAPKPTVDDVVAALVKKGVISNDEIAAASVGAVKVDG